MGTGLKRQVNESLQGKRIEAFQFNGAESPDRPKSIYEPAYGDNIQRQKSNDQVFRNLRAQCYASLRDRVYRTYEAVVKRKMADPEALISFSSSSKSLAKLRSELCRMPIKPNGSGLFELYSKPDMRRIFKVSSPNLADCVMMSERVHIEKKRQVDISTINAQPVNYW